jgi:CelD/BcsL family acetyltransferase involved in cellulose biosynthesis
LTLFAHNRPLRSERKSSLNDASGLATSPTGFAAALERAEADRLRPFARCEVFDDLAAARAPWAQIEAMGLASPYQSYEFAEAWLQTAGRARGIAPMIVVARDGADRVSAVLPLGRMRRGPVRTAEFIGAKDANFKMGLFRPGIEASGEAIADLLRRAARMVTPRVDAFWLTNQPYSWQGVANPMAALPRRPSPSFGYKTLLDRDFDGWLAAHYTKDAQKKLRKKARRLGEIGRVASVTARDEAEAREILAAFQRQKAARMLAVGAPNAYESPGTARFFEIAATKNIAGGAQTIELHALKSGERIVATFGGLRQEGRFCGMFISYEMDPEISRCSPGQLLVIETIRDLTARGFTTFDLGVGEGRYKDENCETEEPLFDTAVAVTAKGYGFQAAAMSQRRIKRWIKQTPWAWRFADQLRRRAAFLRGAQDGADASGGSLDP